MLLKPHNEHIVFSSATEIVNQIKSRQVTVLEVATAFLEQIKKYNP